MKLKELLSTQLLESTITGDVTTLKQLKAKEYQAGEVNVTGDVWLYKKKLVRLPVKFGKVGGKFYCSENRLISLEGAPHTVDSFYCGSNQLTSLVGIHKIIKKINGTIALDHNPIKSGGIGLILIEGLTRVVSDLPAFEIISKYLGQGKKGLLLCQDELIGAGYEEFAQL